MLCNFGISYGMSVNGLAERLGCSKEEAQEHMDTYFRNIPKVKQLIDKVKAETKQRGYTRTFFGRIRPFKKPLDAAQGNWYQEDRILKQAFNTTCQGCLYGDELVYTKDGVFKIKELSGKVCDIWNGNEYVGATVFPTGKKHLVKTIFQGDLFLLSSPEHYFLTVPKEGEKQLEWKSAKDLCKGDFVAVSRKTIWEYYSEWKDYNFIIPEKLKTYLETTSEDKFYVDQLKDFDWVEFKSYEDLNEEVEMYDITTAKAPHAYVANCFITHNTGADFAKIAMSRAYEAIKPYGDKVRILTQVH